MIFSSFGILGQSHCTKKEAGVRSFAQGLRLPLALALLAGVLALPGGAQAQQNGCRAFAETGKAVCGRFLEYWSVHGDLAQQGFPISQTMSETSDTDGKVYTVQY